VQNYPDGSLRTSVNQLARFLLAYANDGSHGDARILAADTVRLILTPQAATSPQQGLCWANELRTGRRHWGHNGGDPGIRTTMSFRPSDGVGAIVFVNRAGVDLSKINERLFQESTRISSGSGDTIANYWGQFVGLIAFGHAENATGRRGGRRS
jgi:CubicO group peptidase (beta-lactamase class C family)